MSRSWLSIRVDLIGGGGQDLWPRPGRAFAASPRHTFAQLATAIDDAFARWDRNHLHEFEFADGRRAGEPDTEDAGDRADANDDRDDGDGDLLNERTLTLGTLRGGEQFVYIFDLGDRWSHLCTVAGQRIDPLEQLGIEPEDGPLPYGGWGNIPDQYGRRWDRDDGQTLLPPDPELADLPPLRPGWGSPSRR